MHNRVQYKDGVTFFFLKTRLMGLLFSLEGAFSCPISFLSHALAKRISGQIRSSQQIQRGKRDSSIRAAFLFFTGGIERNNQRDHSEAAKEVSEVTESVSGKASGKKRKRKRRRRSPSVSASPLVSLLPASKACCCEDSGTEKGEGKGR